MRKSRSPNSMAPSQMSEWEEKLRSGGETTDSWNQRTGIPAVTHTGTCMYLCVTFGLVYIRVKAVLVHSV